MQRVRNNVAWKPGLTLPGIVAEVPEGLERHAARLFAKSGWPEPAGTAPGLLQFAEAREIARWFPLPRWCYNIRLVMAETAPAGDKPEQLARMLENIWPAWREWTVATALTYRFSVEGQRVSAQQLRGLLNQLRAAVSPHGFEDDPSNYGCEVILSFRGTRPVLYFRPTFMPDERFTYRLGDVGASMNPVVAANLVRLVSPMPDEAVFDPTCGSGTLLIERGKFSQDARLAGVDVSPVAVKTAGRNLQAAGMSAAIQTGDAADLANWPACSLVIANLPFGNRVDAGPHSIPDLYKAVAANTAAVLPAGGRAVFATANRSAFEQALSAARSLKLLARTRVQSGGLWVHLFVLGKT